MNNQRSAIVLFMFCLTVCAPPVLAGKPDIQNIQVQRGLQVFQNMNCVFCHVDGGNVLDPHKGLKGSDFLHKFPNDRQIADLIRSGVPGTAMDRFGKDRLSDEQLKDLIAYIRSLTPAGKTSAAKARGSTLPINTQKSSAKKTASAKCH